MALAVPLTLGEVALANQLWTEDWRLSDYTLDGLREQRPDFGPADTLLKVVAVNALYGTNVYAVHRVARYIEQMMAPLGSARDQGPELVEQIAIHANQPRRIHSFASKFAHFFISAKSFPIFDSYAGDTLRYHLGQGYVTDAERPYVAWARNFQTLAAEIGLMENFRRLDHYLWLAGQYRKWKANKKAAINAGARILFASNKQVERLLPS